ncbi:LamG-like jellyroll fold domain-containing protein, partial [Aestuariispira insulae]|uniref:LamG-like jellyroll fold domain-containing protein n=1 Tax=Aestuariispira insulae TaxID=1461337 RepID=UPI0015F265A7
GDYVIQDQGDGSYAITDAAGSTDTVTGVETLEFAAGADIDLTAANSGPQAVDAKVYFGNQAEAFIHKLSVTDADLAEQNSEELLTISIKDADDGVLLVKGGKIELIRWNETNQDYEVVSSNEDGQYRFVPIEGQDGPDSFTWRVKDQSGLSSQATVAIESDDSEMPVSNSAISVDGNDSYLGRTFETGGNTQQWVFESWVKRGSTGTWDAIFSSRNGGAGTPLGYISFGSDNRLWVVSHPSDSTASYYSAVTDMTFTDTEKRKHIAVAWDMSQTNAADRIRIYVDGVLATQHSSSKPPVQNWEKSNIGLAQEHRIGSEAGSPDANHFDGEIGQVSFRDGATINDASDLTLGQADVVGGWEAVNPDQTVDYGATGFYLDHGDAAALGTDESGQGNDFAVTGAVTYIADSNQVMAFNTKTVEGTDGNDVIIGNERVVLIDGGAGDDLLVAGDVTGNDRAVADPASVAKLSTAFGPGSSDLSEDGLRVKSTNGSTVWYRSDKAVSTVQRNYFEMEVL